MPFPDGPAFDSHIDVIEGQARRALDALDLGELNGLAVERHVVRAASPARGIVDAAERLRADVIVIASHGRRLFAQIVLGSVARAVIAGAVTPVLCVKTAEHGMLDPVTGALRLRRILAATDLSEQSARALEAARDLAAVHDGVYELVHVVQIEIPPMYFAQGVESVFELDRELRGRIEARLAELAEAHHAISPAMTCTVLEGSPARQIARHADATDADLIVLTRRGLGDTPHLLGGMPERLLHDAHSPVLLL
jgi:nucleotide-binding universal stress UspA family protein